MPKGKGRTKRRYTLHPKLLMVIGVGVAVIAFWRGVWGLMDLYLFPDNLTLSYIASFVVGFLVLYSTHYLIRELL